MFIESNYRKRKAPAQRNRPDELLRTFRSSGARNSAEPFYYKYFVPTGLDNPGWKSLIHFRKHSTVVGLILVFLFASNGRGSAQTESPRSLPAVKSQAEFDSLAVTYDPNTPYALPHVLFVIDRKDQNKIYYVNTRRYPFHKDFVNGTYLSLERGREFFENNYLKPNRRFILGTIAYQTPLQRWT